MTHKEYAEKVWEEIGQRASDYVTRQAIWTREIPVSIIAAALEKQRKTDRTVAAKAIAIWGANQALQVKQRSLAEVVMNAILNAEVEP